MHGDRKRTSVTSSTDREKRKIAAIGVLVLIFLIAISIGFHYVEQFI